MAPFYRTCDTLSVKEAGTLVGERDVEIATWLRALGLEHYAQAFLDAELTPEALPELTDADLRELGLPLGPRKIVLRAIRDLPDLPGPKAEADTQPRPASAIASFPPEAERRQLTVMFVDLIGSTALSGRLDPEEMHQVVRTYQNEVASNILRYEGHVAKFMGDGVLAYFGWPKVHEDEAERAVRSGLAIAAAIPTLVTPAGEPLAARIGIATGLVMVGELVGRGAAREEAIAGEAPNVAARLQVLAEPSSVVVSGATRRLIGNLFDLEDMGPRALKGIEPPVQAFTVRGARTVDDRFAARQAGVPLPLLGRDQELALLLDRWRLAKGGQGQVVMLSGEPGIGKSRIVLALREQLRAEQRTTLRYNCSPFHANSALHPVSDQLIRAAGIIPGDNATTRLTKLRALAAQGNDPEEAMPYLVDLLGLPHASRYGLPPLTPQERKTRGFRALLTQLEGLARQNPVLLVLEDAHWCDPTTLELFTFTIARIASLPALLLVTFRPDFRPPWAGHTHVTSLTLGRLSRIEAGAIAARVAGGRDLQADMLEAIVERTDGVPLFVEELTKAVLESDLSDPGRPQGAAARVVPLAIPSTLRDSLMARLDRLVPVRELAQIGAVIGREFGHQLLAAVAGMQERRLAEALDQLVAAELVFRRDSATGPLYAFKHALVQDAAYQSLLKSRRQQLHARVAEALEVGAAGGDGPPPEVLAHHLTEAGLLAPALSKWLAAGEHAWRRSAYKEAITHLRRGLEIASCVPGRDGRRAEIRLHILLGAALMAAHGPRPETVEAYEQASRLAAETGEMEELSRARWGAWFCHMQRMDVPQQRAIIVDLLGRSDRVTDDSLTLQAHHAAWTTSWVIGDLAGMREHSEIGLRLYDQERHHEQTAYYGGHDAGVCCRYTLGLALWLLGVPDQAVARGEEALGLARQLAHPLTLVICLSYVSWLRLMRGDRGEARILADEAIKVSSEQGIPVYLPSGRITEGALRAMDGDAEAGVNIIRTALQELDALGSYSRRSFQLGLLAEAQLRAGRPRDGLATVAAALRFVAQKGERWYEPELHRLRGELLLAAGGAGDAARAAFEAARLAASERGAVSLELRAATRLAHLDAETGERRRARTILAPLYERFAEGFETADLIQAKALLDAL